MDRRNFLKVTGAGLASASVFNRDARQIAGTNHAVEVPAASLLPQLTADEMDAHHEEAVNLFLANIGKDPVFWRKPPLEFTMDGDVKVFELTCQEIQWETMAGVAMSAMSYNGIVPGPEIRVTEGDIVRVVVTNEMTQSTAIHFHGLLIPNAMDGVPFITQPVIKPGETFSYEFTTRNSGSHMYHSHHNAAEQVTKGLMGAFIIEPKDTSGEPEVSADYTLILNDSTLGFTLNGKGFPYTQPIIAKKGEKIRVRYMNEGFMIHPMHLHGIPQLVIAKDGYPLPMSYMCDTLNVAPGERWDVVIDCTEPGVWAYHCHILNHAESANGMFGMVTVLIVEE